MTRMTTPNLCAAVCFLASVLTLPASALAQQETVLTFSAPVQLPTLLLPAGTYSFVNEGDHKSMSVTEKGGALVTRFQVNPIRRAKAGETVVMRSVQGKPSEVSALYSTGGTTGVEFIYPRAKK